MPSKIEWLTGRDGSKGETINVITGCRPISEGCTNCFAKKMTRRLNAMGVEKYADGFDKVRFHPEELAKIDKFKKPRKIFLCSMSDIFHEDVDGGWLLQIKEAIVANPQHVFFLLTKRPDNAVKHGIKWPSNVWMGVTVENQDNLWRIEELRRIDAENLFISFEPLLGPIDIEDGDLRGISWAIIGAETGTGARPMKAEWFHKIYRHCWHYGKAFFFKKWGPKGKFTIEQESQMNLAAFKSKWAPTEYPEGMPI